MNYIDENPQILTTDIDGILSNLFRKLQSQNNLYALVDGALDEDGKLMQKLFKDLPRDYIYDGTELQTNTNVGPIIITLPKEEIFSFNFLSDIGKTLPCMLLASPRHTRDLKKFFQHRIEVRLENSNIFLFRFYDVNLAKPFIRSLSVQRASKFFGPVETLVWPTVNMHDKLQWFSCSFSPQSDDIFQLSMQVLNEQRHPCWEATDREWKLFEYNFAEDVSLVDLCRYLLDREVNLLQEIPDSEIIKRVSKTVEIAKSYGLSSQYDIYTFCKLELDFYPGMHLHPKIDAILRAQASNSNYKLYELLSLGMQDWDELRLFAEEYLSGYGMKT